MKHSMKARRVFTVTLIVFVVALLLGEMWPRLTIGHNIDGFSGEQQAFAAAAYTETRIFFSGSAESFFVKAIQVHEVKGKTDAEGQRCYEGTVRAYTFFGLPWSSVLVSSCDGEVVRQRWGLLPW